MGLSLTRRSWRFMCLVSKIRFKLFLLALPWPFLPCPPLPSSCSRPWQSSFLIRQLFSQRLHRSSPLRPLLSWLHPPLPFSQLLRLLLSYPQQLSYPQRPFLWRQPSPRQPSWLLPPFSLRLLPFLQPPSWLPLPSPFRRLQPSSWLPLHHHLPSCRQRPSPSLHRRPSLQWLRRPSCRRHPLQLQPSWRPLPWLVQPWPYPDQPWP